MTYSPSLEAQLENAQSFQKLLASFDASSEGGPVAVSFVNPFSYALVAQNELLLQHIDHWYVDGSLLRRLSNFFRTSAHTRIDRVSFDFSSIAGDVFTLAETKKLKVALIGGTETELNKASAYLIANYPGLDICYARNGFFATDKDEEYAANIDRSGAQIVVIGMGTPRQENVMLTVKEAMQRHALLFTCGGFLTQTGMSGDYYPNWVKKTGFRWLYRAFKHSHVRQRLLKNYPSFTITYLLTGIWQKLKKAFSGN